MFQVMTGVAGPAGVPGPPVAELMVICAEAFSVCGVAVAEEGDVPAGVAST